MAASTSTRLRHSRGNYWRAGCGETRTSGSVAGRAEKDQQHADTSPLGRAYIPMLPELLAGVDITDTLITADALHTTTGTARYITDLGGHYLFTVKGNQPKLRQTLRDLPWTTRGVVSTIAEKSHGRVEIRTVTVIDLDNDETAFPGTRRAVRITRSRTDLSTGRLGVETVYAVTSLNPHEATPTQIAAWLRGHWHIENRVHWVRDTAYNEDRCRIRTASGPQVMATLRNTAINLFRLLGYTNIAKSLRNHGRNHEHALQLLLTS